VKPLKSFPTRSLCDLIRKLATNRIMRFQGRNTRLRWAWTRKLLRKNDFDSNGGRLQGLNLPSHLVSCS
jgi:hypothetical protein